MTLDTAQALEPTEQPHAQALTQALKEKPPQEESEETLRAALGQPAAEAEQLEGTHSAFGPPHERQLSGSSAETPSGDDLSALGTDTPSGTPALEGSLQPSHCESDFVEVCDAPGLEAEGEREGLDEDGCLPCKEVPQGYPQLAAAHFGERFAHRLRWAHAVNSRRRLRLALATASHFLEADVASGPLVEPGQELPGDVPAVPAAPVPPRTRSASSRGPGPGHQGRQGEGGVSGPVGNTRVQTSSGQSVIMAHYPTERSSDLSLERFMTAVLRHNERVSLDGPSTGTDGELHTAPSGAARQRWTVPQRAESEPAIMSEAAAFAKDLNKELEAHASTNGHMITACVGSRRDRPAMMCARRTRKGVKLDFKQFDCVGPTVDYLVAIDAAKRLAGHLWLNADVFAGPGALISPLNAKEFVRLCAEKLPDAVLSLSWGASIISTTRLYTHDMVQRMIELCMCPIVPQALTPPLPPQVAGPRGPVDTKGIDSEDLLYFAPAATCRHITFAVAAEYALGSSDVLRRLLESVPGASLTVFSGVGSLGITPAHVHDLINTFGDRRCFLDLRVSKPWRTCVHGSCGIQ